MCVCVMMEDAGNGDGMGCINNKLCCSYAWY